MGLPCVHGERRVLPFLFVRKASAMATSSSSAFLCCSPEITAVRWAGCDVAYCVLVFCVDQRALSTTSGVALLIVVPFDWFATQLFILH